MRRGSGREGRPVAASPGRVGLIQITAIRLGEGSGHECITEVRWRSNFTFGQCTREGVIAWLSAAPANQAIVTDGSQAVPVLVVRPDGQEPHLRARLDGAWTDALLALPRF